MNLQTTEDRKIILSGNINQQSVRPIYDFIIKMNREDEILLDNGVTYLDPIEILIDSYGGQVHPAYGLMGVMNESITPIHTYGMGAVMSAALGIYLMGDVRKATQFTTFMYHEGSSSLNGYIEEQKQQLTHDHHLQAVMDAVVTKKTKVRQSTLNKVRKEKRCWYIGYEEAVSLNIVTK